ncbi:MAG: XRE family transcriptional regulator [Chloroflexaceae bacterium]|nr:XRE family transcriptional regulator [Chloroflexaceae bacterium]NJO04938.1 XRE family transcriptional regulator [Chloroflexaceae bacterium]
MSEAPSIVLPEPLPDDLPLSVLLFYAAMSQNMALSNFAKQLGIGALSLRQFITGQTQRPRGKTLSLLASALHMTVDEVRRRNELQPTSASYFADWLRDHMNGQFSRARLTRETQISDGALRNYLAGQTLPDADQAQRLSQTLHVDPLELAKVLVANHTIQAGGETLPFAEEDPEYTNAHEPAAYAASVLEHVFDDNTPLQRTELTLSSDEEKLLVLWRQLHPQGRRATLNYIAGLLVEV